MRSALRLAKSTNLGGTNQIMMKYFAPLTAILFLALLACGHRSDEDPQMEKIYFSGITKVDVDGASLGETDTTDWRFDDSWVAQEKALFPPDNLPLCQEFPLDSLSVYLIPNPCKERFIAQFQTPVGTNWKFRLVDEDFNLLTEYNWDQPIKGLNALQIKTDSLPKDTVRLYYQVTYGSCAWYGHGDILIQN